MNDSSLFQHYLLLGCRKTLLCDGFVCYFRLVHPCLPVILEVNISLAWQDLEQQLGLAWEHLNLM